MVRRCDMPRRPPRELKAKDVGRMACAAVANGESQKEIKKEVDKCLPDVVDCDCELARQVLESTLAVLTAVAVAVPVLALVGRGLMVLRASGLYLPAELDSMRRLAIESPRLKKIIEGQYEVIDDAVNVGFKSKNPVVITPKQPLPRE